MGPFFDSHCHLTAAAFDEDRSDVLARARARGVGRIVTIASNPADAEVALELVRDHDALWTTAGIHPHEAAQNGADSLDRVRDLLGRPGVVAVGECGLDYHYDHSPRAVQRRVFDAQIEMATELGLPLVIHSRSCDADMIGAIEAMPAGARGVLHCFSSSTALLETALDHGLHISFTGIVTFKRFEDGDQLAAVPRDRIMIETDAPYLAPVPHRGKRNEPGFVDLVAQAVGRWRGDSVADVASYTAENAIRFYGVD